MSFLAEVKKKGIDENTERVYYRCVSCGEYRVVLTRYAIEIGTASTSPELVALVLSGKVLVVDRKCDRCYAASYSEYTPPAGDVK